jgi:hypothetical protein
MTKKMTRPAADGTDQMVCRTDTKPTSMRVCNKCGEQKAMGEMAPDRHAGDGCRSHCRECRAAYDRRRYLAKRESILAQQRKYHLAEPGIAWAAGHRSRARRYRLQLTTQQVSYDDVIAQWGGSCVYCRIGAFEEIDHIIPVAAGGSHTLMNIVPSCRACNLRKRWTFDEWIIRDHRAAWAERAHRSSAEPPNGVQQGRTQFRPSNARGRS